jgi:hypothetical protein
MSQTVIRSCDECAKVIPDTATRIEFYGAVALVNGGRTESHDRNETCSPACATSRFRKLLESVTEAAKVKKAADCHSIAS